HGLVCDCRSPLHATPWHQQGAGGLRRLAPLSPCVCASGRVDIVDRLARGGAHHSTRLPSASPVARTVRQGEALGARTRRPPLELWGAVTRMRVPAYPVDRSAAPTNAFARHHQRAAYTMGMRNQGVCTCVSTLWGGYATGHETSYVRPRAQTAKWRGNREARA